MAAGRQPEGDRDAARDESEHPSDPHAERADQAACALEDGGAGPGHPYGKVATVDLTEIV